MDFQVRWTFFGTKIFGQSDRNLAAVIIVRSDDGLQFEIHVQLFVNFSNYFPYHEFFIPRAVSSVADRIPEAITTRLWWKMTFQFEKCHYSPYHSQMDIKLEAKLKKLGIFSILQAVGLGLTQQGLSRLVAAQKLTRVGRGLYIHPDADLKGDIGFQVACAKFGPKSAIAGLSALFHYNLVEQVPGHIWIVVPPEKRSSEAGYKLIRTKISMEKCIVSTNGFRIVSLERAVLEGLKLSTKIGERNAIKAARDALAHRRTTILKLGKCAQELGLEKVLQKYIEVIAP